MTAEEYRELDDELIIVLHRFRARGKMSGLQIEEGLTKGALLFAVHDGKVTRFVVYLDRESTGLILRLSLCGLMGLNLALGAG
jgi:ketosteroid isomerase-like protein